VIIPKGATNGYSINSPIMFDSTGIGELESHTTASGGGR